MAEKTDPPDPSGIIDWNESNVDSIPGRRLPTFFANRYHVLIRGDTIRFVIGEAIVGEDDANWHVAFQLTVEAARDLADAITTISDRAEKRRSAIQPEDGKEK